ncbi:MAG TPA: energy transducer TonB [Bacteroidota bacterium]|nr:energy transducer TonB [Bacteroidota bacterium]
MHTEEYPTGPSLTAARARLRQRASEQQDAPGEPKPPSTGAEGGESSQGEERTRAYGAPELKSLYGKYLYRGLLIAVGIHLLVIGAYYLSDLIGEGDAPVVHIRLIRYSELGPPPSLFGDNSPPAISVSAPKAKPNAGVPVPVPDMDISPDQTIATQQDMNLGMGQGAEGGGGGAGTGVPGDIRIDDESPPADFVEVEKEPVIIKAVEPVYPELAVKTGLEGKVWVKIWVSKEGKPKQVVVLQSTDEIFNQPAIDAAKQFAFTPAYMNDGPVSVWVTFPFRFELSGEK